MKCPIDNIDLVMNERQGIEIDYCPQCRGVWLDRGELDKIIERTQASYTQTAPQNQPPSQQPYQQDPGNYGYGGQGEHGGHGGYDKHGGSGKHGRRRGFLGELFD